MANNKQLPSASGGQHIGSTTVYNPTVPFVRNLGNVQPGQIINISGIPSQSPKRITINFEVEKDVAFHFDVRFCFGSDRNVIVRNKRLNNTWGQSERAINGPFPFQAEELFDITILVDPLRFKVAVNNQPLFDFVHRMHFPLIDTLRIRGDVRLCQVRF